MEIESNLIYIVKVNGELQKITGEDIIMSVNTENKDIVVMIDKTSNVDDISKAMKMVGSINK
jgi:hypothetical protein